MLNNYVYYLKQIFYLINESFMPLHTVKIDILLYLFNIILEFKNFELVSFNKT